MGFIELNKLKEIETVKKAIDDIKKAYDDGFQFSDLKVYAGILSIAVEETCQFLEGKQKKELVVGLLNNLINIPLIPESVEKWIFNFIIGILIDNAVKIMKKKGFDIKHLS